jgi:hypothetical protein
MVVWRGRSRAKDRNTLSTNDDGISGVLIDELEITLRQDVTKAGNVGVVISRISVGYWWVTQ